MLAVKRGLFRQYYPVSRMLWLGTDAAIAVACLFGLTLLTFEKIPTQYRILALVVSLVMVSVYSWSDLFYQVRMRSMSQEARILFANLFLVVVAVICIGYATDTIQYFSRKLLLQWIIVSYVAQLGLHALVRKGIHAARKRSMNTRRALLIGCGESPEKFAEKLASSPWLGINVEGYLSYDIEGRRNLQSKAACATRGVTTASAKHIVPTHTAERHNGDGLKFLGTIDNLSEVIRRRRIDDVYVTFPVEHTHHVVSVSQKLLNVNVNVSWVPDLSLFHLISSSTTEIDGQPIICLSGPPLGPGQRLVKRLVDLILTPLILIIVSPVMLVIAIAIKLTSLGPVLYQQRRMGLNGETIHIWKFRTMDVAKGEEIPVQATRDDPRVVTAVGRFLRRWSLDELPQLFQVIWGDMSLVGPRPHPLWLNDRYRDSIRGYMQRHRVKPGITGWAQVNGWRGQTNSPGKMEMRVRHDLWYMNHWSLWFDLKIIFMTVTAVVSRKNAY